MLVDFLDASNDFTPLHHIEVLFSQRTRALLRSGRYSPLAGHVSPLLRAQNYLSNHPNDESAKMILLASQPWSTCTHELWGQPQRSHAFELLKIGYQLRAQLGHGSVVDWWVAYVMPYAVTWAVEPCKSPAGDETKAKQHQMPEAHPATTRLRRSRRGLGLQPSDECL